MYVMSIDGSFSINISHKDVKYFDVRKDHAGFHNLYIVYTDYHGKLKSNELAYYPEAKLANFVLMDIFRSFEKGKTVYFIPSEQGARIDAGMFYNEQKEFHDYLNGIHEL